MPSLTRHDGELMIDHRYSPGLTREECRIFFGMTDFHVGEGQRIHARVLGCNHCGGAQLMNPWRKRERNYCRACDHYICDLCGARTKEAGYVHRTIDQLSDMITSGKYQIAGGPTSNPILVPTGV